MFILNLNNIDYTLMTAVFGIIALISYYFRRKNAHSKDFLVLANYHPSSLKLIFSYASIGLPEFMILAALTAAFGFFALYLFIPLYILLNFIFNFRLVRTNVFTYLIDGAKSSRDTRGFYITYAIFLLLFASVALALMVGLFKLLLGWEFANTSLSMIAVVGICMLIGGAVSIVYNQIFVFLITVVILIVTVVSSAYSFSITDVVNNLHIVAKNNNLNINYFTSFFAVHHWYEYTIGLLLMLAIMLASPLNIIKSYKLTSVNSNDKNLKIAQFLQLIVMVLVMLGGIYALAMPLQSNVIKGSKVVTQQTRLSDGSLGYIIRSVDSNTPSMDRGIVPRQSAISTNSQLTVAEDNQEFDYTSTIFALIKHFLPYGFVLIGVIVLLFYKTISDTISFVTVLSINGFYAPYYNKTREDYENTWAAKVFMFMYFFVIACIGFLLYRYLDIYYMFAVVILFAIPAICSIMGLGVVWWANIIMLAIVVACFASASIAGSSMLLSIFKYDSIFSFTAIVALILIATHIIFAVITKLLYKEI